MPDFYPVPSLRWGLLLILTCSVRIFTAKSGSKRKEMTPEHCLDHVFFSIVICSQQMGEELESLKKDSQTQKELLLQQRQNRYPFSIYLFTEHKEMFFHVSQVIPF